MGQVLPSTALTYGAPWESKASPYHSIHHINESSSPWDSCWVSDSSQALLFGSDLMSAQVQTHNITAFLISLGNLGFYLIKANFLLLCSTKSTNTCSPCYLAFKYTHSLTSRERRESTRTAMHTKRVIHTQMHVHTLTLTSA